MNVVFSNGAHGLFERIVMNGFNDEGIQLIEMMHD